MTSLMANGNFHPTLFMCLKEVENLKGQVCFHSIAPKRRRVVVVTSYVMKLMLGLGSQTNLCC